MSRSCKACRSSEVVPLRPVLSPALGVSYVLFECRACGSRFFELGEHPVGLGEFYNRRGSEPSPPSTEFQVSPYWTHEIKAICGMFGGWPRSTLDVGCRNGELLLHWPAVTERCGVELSEPSAAIARARGLHVIQAHLEQVTFDRSFDVVSCYAILEHLPEPQAFLTTLAGLVCENGILAILVPSHETLKARILQWLGGRWHMECPPEHLVFYSRRFLDQFLAAHGFELIRRRYSSGGMFNPFARIPGVRSAWSRLMWIFDTSSYGNRLPIFDHMYSYYRRRAGQAESTQTPRAA